MHRIYEWHSLNLCIPYRFKTKICFSCTFMYYMQVLSVPLLCNEWIVNIQVLCSIPLAWTWRYCQWYWICLHIQTKGALITCINHCHLLELTLLCLVDLWKFPILRVPGAFIFVLFLTEIHVPVCKEWKSWSYVAFLDIWSGPALFAYVHYHRTLCTSRPWSYYLTFMSKLSNVRDVFFFFLALPYKIG